jgi:Type IV secretion-system coupling protein DNA-binding domain
MTDWLVAPLLSSIALVGAVVFLRSAELRRAMQGARTFSLRFARETDPAAVTTLVAGLSGVRPPWYWRWLRLPTVIFELHAEPGRISHHLIVPRALTGVVMTHLRAALPSVRLIALDSSHPSVMTAAELSLSTTRRPLRTDRLAAAAAAVIGSVQPLRPGERIVIQWLLTPAAVPKPPRLPVKGKSTGTPLAGVTTDGYELLPHSEALRAERAKQAEPLFWATGRVGVMSIGRPAGYLIDRVLGAYHLLNAPGVELRRRPSVPGLWAGMRLNRRSVPLLVWPALLNAAEVTGVLGLPVGAKQLPSVLLGGCRQLPPSADIPTAGCVVAKATFPGSERPLAITPEDRRLHLHVCGPTGVGKSTLLLSLITQDMEAGRGVVVVDPKGDLVSDALRRVPTWRTRDVIVLDPGDDDRPVGLNLLATEQASAELVAEHVVFIFHQLFAAFWGPRTDDVLRAALLTLMHEPDMTLVEVPLLLNDPAFRRRFVARVSEDVVGLAPFWAWYESLSAAERGQVIAPLMNKLRATLLRSRVRYCIGQSRPGLQIEDVLSQGKLLFVPLRKGVLGEEAAALLGSLFVSRLWQATQARTAVPEDKRRPVHLYIDEVQDYLRLPTSVGDMLAQARGLNLSLTVAHQHLGQLTPELRQDLLTNCRSRIVFQTTAKDARAFEQELRPYLTAEDLQGLDRFEVVAQLAVGQRVAPPVTGATLPPPPALHRGTAAREWSRQRHGQERSAIEAAMRSRHLVSAPDSVIGRRPRRAS